MWSTVKEYVLLVVVLVVVVLSPSIIISVHACISSLPTSGITSCAANSVYASSPCCNTGSTFASNYNLILVDFDITKLDVSINQANCSMPIDPICYESNPQNTGDASNNQQKLNSIIQYFTQYSCWNGYVASSPGNNVNYVDTNALLYVSKCMGGCDTDTQANLCSNIYNCSYYQAVSAATGCIYNNKFGASSSSSSSSTGSISSASSSSDNNNNNSGSNNGGGGVNITLIVYIVVGCIGGTLVIVIIVVIFYFFKQRNNNKIHVNPVNNNHHNVNDNIINNNNRMMTLA